MRSFSLLSKGSGLHMTTRCCVPSPPPLLASCSPPSLPSGTRDDSKELRRRRKEGLPASATGLPWLIVAPASVVRVWIEHLKQWGYFSAYQLESRKDVDVRKDATCFRLGRFRTCFWFCALFFRVVCFESGLLRQRKVSGSVAVV